MSIEIHTNITQIKIYTLYLHTYIINIIFCIFSQFSKHKISLYELYSWTGRKRIYIYTIFANVCRKVDLISLKCLWLNQCVSIRFYIDFIRWNNRGFYIYILIFSKDFFFLILNVWYKCVMNIKIKKTTPIPTSR